MKHLLHFLLPLLILTGLHAQEPTLANSDDIAAEAAARQALQVSPETQASSILIHDDCSGDSETLANSGTRATEPGPGTATATVNGASLVRYEGGELLISSIDGTGGQASAVHYGSQTITGGLTFVARVVPSYEAGGYVRNTIIGFSTNGLGGSFNRGCISVTQDTGDTFASVKISSLDTDTDSGAALAGRGLLRQGQEAAFAIKHKTTTHQQYFMQGGELSSFGATLGSDNWIMLGESFADLSGLSVFPVVVNQYRGTTRLRDATLYSSWEPSGNHVSLDFNRDDIGTHVPALEKDPVSGLVIAAWNRGVAHVGEGIASIRYSVRLANNTWTTASDLIAAPTAPAGSSIGSISNINGQLWLHYWKSPTGADGGTLYWRTLDINASTGAATLGPETLMGVPGANNLSFSKIRTGANGRLWVAYHHTGNDGCRASYSDDDGATWTEVTLTPTGNQYEPDMVFESDGALGCYMRSNGNSAGYVRCEDPDLAPATWSALTVLESIPQHASNGSRIQVCKTSDGQIYLVGNDHKTTRRNLTIWKMGDNAAVLGKVRHGDWNPITNSGGTSIMQYPCIIEDGEDHLLIAYSRQPTAVYAGGICIQVDRRTIADPVDVLAGGTGRRDVPPTITSRERPDAVELAFSTAPVPDMSLSDTYHMTLTASTAVIGAPINGLPYEVLTWIIQQDSGGNETISSWNSAYEFNGVTPTLQTAGDATNVFKFRFNPLTAKWVLESFY